MPTLPTVPTPSKEGNFFLGGMFYFHDNQHCPLRHQYMVTHINHYVMNEYVCIIFTCPHCPQCPQCPHLLLKIIWIDPFILTCPHCPQCPQCPHLLWEKIMDTPFYFDMPTLPTMPTPSKEDKKNRGGVLFDHDQHCPLS